jgi:hypothetical protein
MYSIADVSAAHAIANDIMSQYLQFAGQFVLDAAGIKIDEDLSELASVNSLAWFIQWKSTGSRFPGMMNIGSQPSPNKQSKLDGDTFLKSVLEALGAEENYDKIPGSTRSGKSGKSEPDLLDPQNALVRQYDVTEIKDEKNISYSSQLQIQNDYARNAGKTHNLIIGPKTQSVSKQLQQEIRRTGGIIVKYDPGKRAFTKVKFDPKYRNRVL